MYHTIWWNWLTKEISSADIYSCDVAILSICRTLFRSKANLNKLRCMHFTKCPSSITPWPYLVDMGKCVTKYSHFKKIRMSAFEDSTICKKRGRKMFCLHFTFHLRKEVSLIRLFCIIADKKYRLNLPYRWPFFICPCLNWILDRPN